MSETNNENRLGVSEEVKKSRLEAEADIYQQRETLTPVENMKTMTAKDRFYYFKEYYLKALVVLLILGSILGWIFYSIAKGKDDEELFVGYVDCFYNETAADIILEEFANSIGRKYTDNAFADDSFFSTYTDNQWLSDFVERGALDVLVMDKQLYEAYARKGILLDLSEYLDIEEYSDYVVYAKDNNGDKVPTAFKCNSIPIHSTQTGEELDTYLAILKKSSQIENAIEYIKYATHFNYEEPKTDITN